jgi:hypothetical protein
LKTNSVITSVDQIFQGFVDARHLAQLAEDYVFLHVNTKEEKVEKILSDVEYSTETKALAKRNYLD